MRVAIIAEVFLPKIDGVVHRTLNLIRELRSARRRGAGRLPPGRGLHRLRPCPVVEFRSFSFPLYPEYRIGLPDERLVEALERVRAGRAPLRQPVRVRLPLLRPASPRPASRVPSVFSFHTLYGEFVKQYKLLRPLSGVLWWLMREYHNRADINLTVSTVMQDELVQARLPARRALAAGGGQRAVPPRPRSDPAMRARLAGRPRRTRSCC